MFPMTIAKGRTGTMMNEALISQAKEKLRQSELKLLEAHYAAISADYDAQTECRAYESKIREAQKKARTVAWAQEIYTLQSSHLSRAAAKYFSLTAELGALVKAADDVVAKENAALAAKAKALDEKILTFNGSLSNERIAQAREFLRLYRSTPREALVLCRRATADEIKRFEAGLDRNQRENDLRAKAKKLDNKFAALTPLTRSRVSLSGADAVLAEIRSTPSEILRLCQLVNEQAITGLANQIKIEKRLLGCEEQIDRLKSTKAHTHEWCREVFSAFSQLSPDIDKYQNAEKLKNLQKDAIAIDIALVCEPYSRALDPKSDFKTVLSLNEGLPSFKEKNKLIDGIPAFDTKWTARVEQARKEASRYADDSYKQAKAYYDKHNYSRALTLFLTADEYGNADAAYMLGEHYYFGNGVKEDIHRAIKYYEKAANAGVTAAMVDLADLTEDSDPVRAFNLRKRAIDAGATYAKISLAQMYFEGKGTPRSYSEARRLFEELALCDTTAAAYLGKIYAEGLGVSKNEALALRHYEAASHIPWAKAAGESLRAKLDTEKRASELDRKFAALTPVKRNRAYFSSADAVLAEIRSASAAVLHACQTVNDRAVANLSRQIETEKSYLDGEEKIERLVSTKSRTREWCQSVFSLFSALSPTLDKHKNASTLRALQKDAAAMDLSLVCEPYSRALDPKSDFKTVLSLDEGLSSFKEKSKLTSGIPSFTEKWTARVAQARKDARRYAESITERVRSLYSEEKYSECYALCKEVESYGAPYITYMLGRIYYYGRSVPKDLTKGLRLLEKAADNGISVATSTVADIYEHMLHLQSAFEYRQRAVAQGYYWDKLPLAKMYFEGKGTDRSYPKARALFEELAAENNEEAIAYLGYMYEYGLGVSQNEQQALRYYQKASSIDWAKDAGKALKEKLDGEAKDREIDEALARAKAGDAAAQLFIGECYYTGYRTEQSYTRAIEWFERAAEQGNGKAMSLLGDIYYNGTGVRADVKKAEKYYKKATKHGER